VARLRAQVLAPIEALVANDPAGPVGREQVLDALARYDLMPQRAFEFIPIWGFAVVLLYRMRRVDCRRCGVKVEEVPWGTGKHQLTKAYMLYLAQWARKLSWKETAQSFHTSWDKVHQAVSYVVEWGLQHRQLGPIRATGVDEIAYGKGHKYLTLVYQIEAGCTRLLWVGQERTRNVSSCLRHRRKIVY
jgi:transposase